MLFFSSTLYHRCKMSTFLFESFVSGKSSSGATSVIGILYKVGWSLSMTDVFSSQGVEDGPTPEL